MHLYIQKNYSIGIGASHYFLKIEKKFRVFGVDEIISNCKIQRPTSYSSIESNLIDTCRRDVWPGDNFNGKYGSRVKSKSSHQLHSLLRWDYSNLSHRYTSFSASAGRGSLGRYPR